MPAVAILKLAIPLAVKYGPKIGSAIKNYGPKIGSAVKNYGSKIGSAAKSSFGSSAKTRKTIGKLFSGDKLVDKSHSALGAAGSIAGLYSTGVLLYDQFFKDTPQENQAKASGITPESFAKWTELGAEIGLDSSQIMEMMTTLSDRFIQAAQSSEAKEALQQELTSLRLDYDQLSKLKPDIQLQAVMEAAQKRTDKEQQVLEVVGKLAGKEAGTLARYVMKETQPVNEKLEEKNFSQSVKAAVEGEPSSETSFPENLTRAAEKTSKEKKKTLLPEKGKLPELGGVLKKLTANFKALSEPLPKVVTGFGDMAKWFEQNRLDKASTTAKFIHSTVPRLLSPNLAGQAADNEQPSDDYINQMMNSLTKPQNAPPVNHTQNMPISMYIYQQPGESSTELATRVKDELTGRTSFDTYQTS